MIHIAHCILAYPEAWGILLCSKYIKKHVAEMFTRFLSKYECSLMYNRITSRESIAKWINEGLGTCWGRDCNQMENRQATGIE